MGASRRDIPPSNGSVTDTCCVCGGPLPPGRPRSTCSDACRQAKWRRHHQVLVVPQPPPPNQPRKPVTVYECPECGTRQLGIQLCDACHSFMRRLGYGGLTPCCGEPATFEELLEA